MPQRCQFGFDGAKFDIQCGLRQIDATEASHILRERPENISCSKRMVRFTERQSSLVPQA